MAIVESRFHITERSAAIFKAVKGTIPRYVAHALKVFDSDQVDKSKFKSDEDRVRYIIGIAKGWKAKEGIVRNNPIHVLEMQESSYGWTIPPWTQLRLNDADSFIKEFESAAKR